MEILKNVIKNTFLLGIVGILLGAAAGPLASMMGPSIIGSAGMTAAAHSAGTILWTGAFFGAFGGIHAALAPAMDWALGSKKEQISKDTASTDSDVSIHNIDIQPNLDMDVGTKTKLYTQIIEMEKSAPPNRSV